MFAMSGKFIPVLLIYYVAGFTGPVGKVSRSVMSRLYPNGMGYDKCDNFAGLLFNLVMNKAIELKLQRIDHLR